jgi:hypothetical protein
MTFGGSPISRKIQQFANNEQATGKSPLSKSGNKAPQTGKNLSSKIADLSDNREATRHLSNFVSPNRVSLFTKNQIHELMKKPR